MLKQQGEVCSRGCGLMEAHLQLIKSFMGSALGLDCELSAEFDTDGNAVIQT